MTDYNPSIQLDPYSRLCQITFTLSFAVLPWLLHWIFYCTPTLWASGRAVFSNSSCLSLSASCAFSHDIPLLQVLILVPVDCAMVLLAMKLPFLCIADTAPGLPRKESGVSNWKKVTNFSCSQITMGSSSKHPGYLLYLLMMYCQLPLSNFWGLLACSGSSFMMQCVLGRWGNF